MELDEPLGKNDGAVAGTRYFQCQPKYGLFAPVHKVTKIGFPSTTPAKAKAAAVRRVMAATPASLKRSPSASSLSSMSSVASSVSSKPSRTGLVSPPPHCSASPQPGSASLVCALRAAHSWLWGSLQGSFENGTPARTRVLKYDFFFPVALLFIIS